MNRLPTFAENIARPVARSVFDHRSFEDIKGIIKEIEMFACPQCGHITPDHRWMNLEDGTQPCLKPGCPCKVNFAFFTPDDERRFAEDVRLLCQLALYEAITS